MSMKVDLRNFSEDRSIGVYAMPKDQLLDAICVGLIEKLLLAASSKPALADCHPRQAMTMMNATSAIAVRICGLPVF
jgi:hypothetical protein